MSRKSWVFATLITALTVAHLASPAPAEAQTFSYAVKFVCGFNRTNLGTPTDGSIAPAGENVVKIGNYATDVNIFNPGNDTKIKKKVLILVEEGRPVGREPNVVPARPDVVHLAMPTCSATYDDCNEILRLAGIPVFPGVVPPLYVGFLVIQSPTEIDVTAVYTAEICSDLTNAGGTGMCRTPAGGVGFAAFGAGISIDVEQIKPTIVP